MVTTTTKNKEAAEKYKEQLTWRYALIIHNDNNFRVKRLFLLGQNMTLLIAENVDLCKHITYIMILSFLTRARNRMELFYVG